MSLRIVRDVGTVAIAVAGVALVVAGTPAAVGWVLIVTAAALSPSRVPGAPRQLLRLPRAMCTRGPMDTVVRPHEHPGMPDPSNELYTTRPTFAQPPS